MNSTESESVISADVIETLRELQDEGEPDLVTELFEMFFQDAPMRISEMLDAAKGGVARDLERAAHSLKSASANLGCHPMSETCARIEKMGRSGEIDGALELVAKVDEQFREAKNEAEARYIQSEPNAATGS